MEQFASGWKRNYYGKGDVIVYRLNRDGIAPHGGSPVFGASVLMLAYGDAFWPLKVYARYLLLEHAVRLPGNIEGDQMAELVQAADVIVVPSREGTPWWPILAAWVQEVINAVEQSHFDRGWVELPLPR